MGQFRLVRGVGWALMIASIGLGFWALRGIDAARLAWLVHLIALFSFFVGFGAVAQGSLKGIFLNKNNRWSMSHSYTLMWSVLILGTFLTFWQLRLAAGAADPMNVGIDPNLVYLMGLTSASFGTATFIQSREGRAQALDPIADVVNNFDSYVEAATREHGLDAGTRKALLRARGAAGALAGDPRAPQPDSLPIATPFLLNSIRNHQNKLPDSPDLSRPSARGATPMDMLMSEDRANMGRADLGRAQLVLFTFLAMMAFSWTVWNLLVGDPCSIGGCDQLPLVSGGIVGILGISHAGYLGTKAVRRNS